MPFTTLGGLAEDALEKVLADIPMGGTVSKSVVASTVHGVSSDIYRADVTMTLGSDPNDREELTSRSHQKLVLGTISITDGTV